MLARSNAELLQDEIDKLDKWRDQCIAAEQFPIWFENTLRLRRKLIDALSKKRFLNYYLQDAIALNSALANPDDHAARETLRTRSQLTIGSADPERKAWGAGLIILGIAILVVAALVLTTILACPIPLMGFFLLLAGNTSFCVGISFFRSGLQTGMAKMLDVILEDFSHQDSSNTHPESHPTVDLRY